MKFLSKLLFIPAFLILFSGCEEDLNKTQLNEEIVANTLSDLSATDFVLNFDIRNDAFDTFEWTAPDFGFEASVTYELQMDVNTDFSSAVVLVSTQSLSASPSVSDVNAALLGLGLDPEVSGEVSFRMRSTVNTNVDAVISNTVTVNVTPYVTSFPPIYVIGDAQGWNLANAVELVSIAPGVYQGFGQFQNSGKFRFFATPSWDAQQWGWSFFEGGTLPSDLASGEDTDSNFLYGGTTGTYMITVTLSSKTIQIEEAELPTLFIIGDAQGWNLANAFELTFVSVGRFEGTGAFQNNGKFRFFEIADWNATQYRYDYFADGSLPAEFSNPLDNDNNFLFNGATGTYTISINLNDKTVTIEEASGVTYPSELFMVGDAQGWDMANAVALTALGNGDFEATADFTQDGKFRFFEEADWAATAYGWSYFADGTVDTELGDGADGDSNFQFLASTGSYKIEVSFSSKTIEVRPPSGAPDNLFIIGDAQAWTLGNALQLNNLGDGEFEVIGNFTQGGKFRFFEEADWAATQYGHSFFSTGTIDSDLADGADGDSNFSFAAVTGVYTLHLNYDTKEITVVAATAPNLYLVGDDQSWTFANSPAFTWQGGGKYTASASFTNNATFRFFAVADDWSSDFGAGFFTSGIDPDLQAVGDGDDNFRFIGTTGTFTINVDLYNRSVEMN